MRIIQPASVWHKYETVFDFIHRKNNKIVCSSGLWHGFPGNHAFSIFIKKQLCYNIKEKLKKTVSLKKERQLFRKQIL